MTALLTANRRTPVKPPRFVRDFGGREDSVTKVIARREGTRCPRTSPCAGDAIHRYQYDRRIISGSRAPVAVP
jgi:hypothetical protein